MRIGYPCINRTLGCSTGRTFRLKSYSEERLCDAINENLSCLENILKYNIKKEIFFFRISSEIIPFASHPVCKLNWQYLFKKKLEHIGAIIKKNNIRISMHPDQYTLLNALDQRIVERSIKELTYHAEFLDLLTLDRSAKIQIHIGGTYQNKSESMNRFIARLEMLHPLIRKRLVIENDERSFTIKNCLQVNKTTEIPVLFDSFHHSLLNNGESIRKTLEQCSHTWKRGDGPPMVDYSSQNSSGKRGNHAQSINQTDFKVFLEQIQGIECDVMLEIKDKERSALKALTIVRVLDLF